MEGGNAPSWEVACEAHVEGGNAPSWEVACEADVEGGNAPEEALLAEKSERRLTLDTPRDCEDLLTRFFVHMFV